MGFFTSDTEYKSPIADVMRQPRRDVLDMTMYLLGFGPQYGGQAGGYAAPSGQGQGQGVGTRSGGGYQGQAPGGYQGGSWGWAPTAGGGQSFTGQSAFGTQSGFHPGMGGDPSQRVESVFGPLVSPLQRQAMDAASHYLNQPLPQQRALEALYGQMATNPGQGVMDALQPRYQQNLATARQSGARFGSGTAVREAQAANDYNLLSAQALQQGVTQQQEAAKTINLMAQGIQETWANAAALGDTETQRRLQILLSMLQTIQGATFGIQKQAVTSPSALDTIGGFVGNVGGVASGFGLGGGGGGGMPSTSGTGPGGWGGDATYYGR